MKTEELQRQRVDIQNKITKLDGMRKDIFADEKERQARINALNALQTKKTRREGELQNDTSGIKNLLGERAETEKEVASQKQFTVNAQNAVSLKQSQIKGKQSELAVLMDTRKCILAEMKRAVEVDTGINTEPESDICPYCEQKLPAKKIAEAKKKIEANIALAEARKQKNIDNITERGNAVKKSIDKINQEIESLASELLALQQDCEHLHTETTKAVNAQIIRLAEIDELIKNNPKPDPAKDEQWQKIVAEIAKAQDGIGEPASEQLQALDNRRTTLNGELAEINKALAQADRAVQDKARIVELEAKEKTLSQQLSDIEGQLAQIGDYTQQVSTLIESAVNGKFKYVKFKLFEQCLNGNIEDACEATFNGVPYSDLSTGQQILVGIDVINTLSAHYGMSVPLFIDRSESMTLPIEANGQTIELYAQRGVKKLTISKKESYVNV